MMDAKSVTIPEGAVARILVGDEVVWKTGKIITAEPMLIKNTGADCFERWNLTPTSSNGQSNSSYFTFKYIPIEGGATYYAQYGTRSWYFDSEKTAIKSVNIRTNTVPYQFTAPENACYISIAYNYDTVSSSDLVYINKVEQDNVYA